MNEAKPPKVRVDVLLRALAQRLLKARSPAGLLKAVAWAGEAFDLSVACIAPVAALREGHARDKTLLWPLPRAQRAVLDALAPLREHPLFAETLAASGTLTGSEVRERHRIPASAWQAKLPPALKNRETLSFMVRFEEGGRWREAWFVLLTTRAVRPSGIARSFMVVATQLAYDRFRALSDERCGRVTSALRANDALRLIANAFEIDVVQARPSQRHATRREGSRNRVH